MRYLLMLFFILAASACDYMHGVRHHARINSVPSSQCVKGALNSVKGVSDAKYWTEEEGRPLTLFGIKKPHQLHRYSYKYAGLNGNFYFIVNYKSAVEFAQTYLMINKTPPQKEVDAIRPGMFSIEKEIEKQCGIVGLTSSIEETCLGVKCENSL